MRLRIACPSAMDLDVGPLFEAPGPENRVMVVLSYDQTGETRVPNRKFEADHNLVKVRV